MVTRLFTFGFGHAFHNKFVRISAESHRECRHVMMQTFGERWSFDYEDEDEQRLLDCDITELMSIVAVGGNMLTNIPMQISVKGEYKRGKDEQSTETGDN